MIEDNGFVVLRTATPEAAESDWQAVAATRRTVQPGEPISWGATEDVPLTGEPLTDRVRDGPRWTVDVSPCNEEFVRNRPPTPSFSESLRNNDSSQNRAIYFEFAELLEARHEHRDDGADFLRFQVTNSDEYQGEIIAF